MQEYEAGILRTEFRDNNMYLIDIICEPIAKKVLPGQFVQVKVGNRTDPFLRRTFSVCDADADSGEIKLMVKAKGPGTELLCSLKRGKSLNIIGSLGRGFDIRLGESGPCILVAGGIGAAPLILLAKRLKQSTERNVTFMMGAENHRSLKIIDGLIVKGVNVLKATDDGSSGYHGPVTKLLQDNIASISPAAVYACGPIQMLKAVANLTKNEDFLCQVSMEERMACGIGACFGCVVNLSNGQTARACVDGPVFFADEVSW